MLNTLKKFDKETSNAILARTALYLSENLDNSLLASMVNESEIRRVLLKEISEKLKTSEPNKIIDYIDSELEKDNNILQNTPKIIERLSTNAQLPSDLFKIEINQPIKDIYNNSINAIEEITLTVKMPDAEYHFTNSDISRPGNISLFLKKYKGDFPYNDFNLLVIGERKGINLIIHQVWRMYEDLFNFNKEKNLLELLEDFAEKFGVEVTFQNQKAKFFLSEIAKSEKDFKINVDNKDLVKDKKGKISITFAHFTEVMKNSDKKLSLFLVIDLNKYRSYLKRHDKAIK